MKIWNPKNELKYTTALSLQSNKLNYSTKLVLSWYCKYRNKYEIQINKYNSINYCLYTVYTVYTVYAVYTVHAVYIVYSVYTVYAVYAVYIVYSVYVVYTIYAVYSVYAVYAAYAVYIVYAVYAVYAVCTVYAVYTVSSCLCSPYHLFLIPHLIGLTAKQLVPLIFISQLNGLETWENWREWVSLKQEDQRQIWWGLYLCKCGKNTEEDRIEFEFCLKWEHHVCAGITKEEYKVLNNPTNIMFFVVFAGPKLD